jgi:hypothetical protein
MTTKDKIIAYLSNSPDHAATRRDILMRLSYREDFQTVYQDLQDQKIIEEYGRGTKANPKLVCLSFRFLQGLIV